MTPEARRLRASTAAHTSWARTPDRAARTAAAREARWARYLEQARELQGPQATPEAVEQAAEHLRQADLKRMAFASAKARRTRKAGGGGDGQAA
jgi:hypothetical protein